MNELRERFDVIVSELIASYRNIHYHDMDTKERIGCLVGRAQTIAISLMEQYNDAHTQEESMFLADEFMGLLSDNTELNELKFDTSFVMSKQKLSEIIKFNSIVPDAEKLYFVSNGDKILAKLGDEQKSNTNERHR